jgi:DNA-binding MarR family transcriptional regulator
MKDNEWHNHHRFDGHRQERFLHFVRHVCPEADPTSVVLFGQLMRANNQLVQAAERNLEDAGLTYAKFRLLVSLHRGEEHGPGEGMQPSELSDLQGISRNTVSALIAGLEKDGLISRELHGTDHRRFVIRLTPEGRRLLKAKLGSQFKFVSGCFKDLSLQERQTLAALLTRLNESLVEQDK